jgi:hypothetical protein
VLDAAIPSHIVKGEPTELQVLIRLPESVGLKGVLLEDDEAEAKPEDVRSTKFGVTFPIGADGRAEQLKIRVNLKAPDFNPPEQAANLFVPPDADSRVLSFVLTATRTGLLKMWVELQWEDAPQGQRRLATQCVAQASDVPEGAKRHVVRIPLEVGAGKVTLQVPSGGGTTAQTAERMAREYNVEGIALRMALRERIARRMAESERIPPKPTKVIGRASSPSSKRSNLCLANCYFTHNS